jgi:hypothetical protein
MTDRYMPILIEISFSLEPLYAMLPAPEAA